MAKPSETAGPTASATEKAPEETSSPGKPTGKKASKRKRKRSAKKRATKLINSPAPDKADDTADLLETNGRSSTRSQRPFPARTLEEALAVPKAIREKNNGNEWDTELVAKASADLTSKSNKFFYLAAASRDYGLTIGSRDTEKIGLAPLGRDIFFAGDEESARKKRIEAFFSVDIFKKVYNHYGSGKLPEDQYLNNTLLKDFGLATEFHAEFRRIFEANCKFLGIEAGTGAGSASDEITRAEHGADIRVVGDPKAMTLPFFVLYDFRVLTCHLASDDTRDKSLAAINEQLGLDRTNAQLEAVYFALLPKLADSLVAIAALIK